MSESARQSSVQFDLWRTVISFFWYFSFDANNIFQVRIKVTWGPLSCTRGKTCVCIVQLQVHPVLGSRGKSLTIVQLIGEHGKVQCYNFIYI